MTKRPTLSSLARELGVSTQTVSNVLNAPERVKASTRERVQAHIDASGYQPSSAGRALRTQRSMTVVMRLPRFADGINGALIDRFLHRTVKELGERGYGLLLIDAADRHQETALINRLCAQTAADGAIILDTASEDERLADLVAKGIPVVAFGRPWGVDASELSWIDVDGRAGARAAAEHLTSLGCAKIAFLGWSDDSDLGNDRRAGWLDACGDAAGPSVVLPDEAAAAAQAARRLLDEGVDGFVCASDSLALGALTVIKSGRVVGFDDTPVAAAVGLTSVRQPIDEVAHAVVEQLVSLMTSVDSGPRQLLLAPELVVREVNKFFTD